MLIVILFLLFSCNSYKKEKIFKVDNNKDYTIECINNIKNIKKKGFINLILSNSFNDTIDIYKNNKAINSFFKNDNYFDENGDKIIIKDGSIRSYLIKIESVKIRDSLTIKLRKEKIKLKLVLYPNNYYKINKYDKYIVVNIATDSLKL